MARTACQQATLSVASGTGTRDVCVHDPGARFERGINTIRRYNKVTYIDDEVYVYTHEFDRDSFFESKVEDERMSKCDCVSVCDGESCVCGNMSDLSQSGTTSQTDSDWQGKTAAATTSTHSKITVSGRQGKTSQETAQDEVTTQE